MPRPAAVQAPAGPSVAAQSAVAAAPVHVPDGQRDFSGPAHAALKQFFGYDSFRPGQFPVVNSILNGRDVMAVMPTGAGKSMCYQLPATVPGTLTLVVTPLRALMRDQVQHLRDHGIAAALIDSQVDWQERNDIYRAAAARQISLLYAAPERFQSRDFLDFAQHVPIDMIVVDEAHCVLQWGSDFRPDYRNIAGFVARLPKRPVIAAFTATATPRQRDEIIANLGLRDPYRITTSFDRPNIHFRVIKATPKNRMAQIVAWARQHGDECGIVYSASRKRTEQMADALRAAGVNAEFFHARMPEDRKGAVQDAFLRGDVRVICATTAFGMGVDKSDVRWVINDSVPASMEEYYQMAGRAGRDRERSTAILMWSDGDFVTLRKRLDEAGSALTDPRDVAMAQQAAKDRLNAMSRYCEAKRCLRAEMLGYFGEQASQSCGDCSVCDHEGDDLVVLSDAERRRINAAAKSSRNRARRATLLEKLTAHDKDDIERAVEELTAQRYARTGKHPAITTLSGILYGGDNETFLISYGLNKLPQYGKFHDRFDKPVITAVIEAMEARGDAAINNKHLILTGERGRAAYAAAGAVPPLTDEERAALKAEREQKLEQKKAEREQRKAEREQKLEQKKAEREQKEAEREQKLEQKKAEREQREAEREQRKAEREQKLEQRKAESAQRREELEARVASLGADDRAVAEQAIVSMVEDLCAAKGEAPAMSSVTYTLAGEGADFIAAAGLTSHPRFGELAGRFDKDTLRTIATDMVDRGLLAMEKRRLSVPDGGSGSPAPSSQSAPATHGCEGV